MGCLLSNALSPLERLGEGDVSIGLPLTPLSSLSPSPEERMCLPLRNNPPPRRAEQIQHTAPPSPSRSPPAIESTAAARRPSPSATARRHPPRRDLEPLFPRLAVPNSSPGHAPQILLGVLENPRWSPHKASLARPRSLNGDPGAGCTARPTRAHAAAQIVAMRQPSARRPRRYHVALGTATRPRSRSWPEHAVTASTDSDGVLSPLHSPWTSRPCRVQSAGAARRALSRRGIDSLAFSSTRGTPIPLPARGKFSAHPSITRQFLVVVTMSRSGFAPAVSHRSG